MVLGILGILGRLLLMVPEMEAVGKFWNREREKAFFSYLWNCIYPAPVWEGEDGNGPYSGGSKILEEGAYAEQIKKLTQAEDDPAYRMAKAAEAFFQEHRYLEIYGGEETGGLPGEGVGNERLAGGAVFEGGMDLVAGNKTAEGAALTDGNEAAGGKAYPGKMYSLAQLEDYDFLMKHFYNVHTSTTAGRDLMDAKKLLGRDFRLAKEKDAVSAEALADVGEQDANEGGISGERGAETAANGDAGTAGPQILIYHTHSQEAFADSRKGETIVAVGEYLARCLTERGFSVYHDSSEYDVREGELDRNKAYRYALEGVTEILEENPSIQVVIDLHRDGVGANTHLVTEVNGKPTAQIMFFNGMSQTPEGPIPYLENPYREDNLAFSLQLQLKAAAWYPGFARKIYLKGLRYNQHLRPCSCLVEVGAQTNTYQEARNAMEPLADIFAMVLL